MSVGALASVWEALAVVLQWTASAAAIGAGIWLLPRRERFGPAGSPLVLALVFAGLRCLTALAMGTSHPLTFATESLRNLSLLWTLFRLFGGDGRDETLGPIKPVVVSLALVELLQLGLTPLGAGSPLTPEGLMAVFHLVVMLRLMFIIGALVLVHNLYGGASNQARLALRWPASALGIVWGLDLNFYTVAYLTNGWVPDFAALRCVSALALAALLTLGSAKDRDALRFAPSRAVAFQSVSLLVIGTYMMAMFAVAEWLSHAGGQFARLIEYGFLVIAALIAVIVLPSRKLRSWLRVTMIKHLFRHRYDYRAEWLRLTRTIGGGDKARPLHERVVQAIADIADSPSGLLLVPGEHGELVLGARWEWPTIEVPAPALAMAAVTFLEREGFIVDLDHIRAGRDHRGESAVMPQWLTDDPRAWALVPLIHYERLVGAVVLARAPHNRQLDWEDFDLLRVAGQQLASYLAEHSGQEALAEANRFDEFNRRIAFVMHDIKNLASQLSLLARNAERHAENPEFRADMLVTLRNAADKLNGLLARLSRYGGGAIEQLESIDAPKVAKAVVDRYRSVHPVVLAEVHACRIEAAREPLEQALCHLIQNAIDASEGDTPVFVSVTSNGIYCHIEVVDSGAGMSPEFVRNKLFKPFISSKPGGFGIGAFEARQLVRAMHGRLDVESREGFGSRFVIRLPLAAATTLLSTFADAHQDVA